jgi:hypothetical protein
MPNFCIKESMIHMPVWVENPTDKPLTWRYDNEYTTFDPGMFRDLNTNEMWPVPYQIAVHFKKSLPELIIHITKPEEKEEEVVNIKDLENKPLEEMNIQELRHLGKSKGMTFHRNLKRADIIGKLTATTEEQDQKPAE